MLNNEIFIGRDNELKLLLDDFENVKQGQPTIRVLLGETGLGKTRLIQEFYQEISSMEDNKYWPERLEVKKNLSLNPNFEQSYLSDIDKIPWFWWATRGQRPNQRNVSEEKSSVLVKSQGHLEAHLKFIQNELHTDGNKLSFAESSTKVISTLLDTFALGGIVTMGVSLYGLVQDTHNAYKCVNTIQNESTIKTIKHYQEKEQEDITEIMTKFFSEVIFNEFKIPLVLIIDDAQWIDQESVLFYEKIYSLAIKNNWPLYLLASHWSGEWHTDQQFSLYPKDSPLSQPIT